MSSKQKRSALIDVGSLTVRDNVPEGCVVSLAGLPGPLSFAELFRDEIQARGLGVPRAKPQRDENRDD